MIKFGALNLFDSFIKKLKKTFDCINHVIYTCVDMSRPFYIKRNSQEYNTSSASWQFDTDELEKHHPQNKYILL